MRARSRPDDRVAEAAQRRLEALVAELGGPPAPVRDGRPRADALGASHPADPEQDSDPDLDPDLDLDPELDPDPDGDDGDGPSGGRHARRPLPTTRRAASWAGDRVPPHVAALRLHGRHLAVVGLLLVLGLLLAGRSYLQATGGVEAAGEVVPPRASGGVAVAVPGEPTPSGSPAAVTGTATAPGTTGTASSDAGTVPGAAPAGVVVDVEGEVRRPGIAVLPTGSRVVDALEAAGGPRPGTDLRGLNLARPLVDGEQLLVGVDPAAGVAAGALTGPPTAAPVTGSTGSGGPVALVDLNTADQAALETLPGVGPVTAAAILQWRAEHGSFTAVDELLEVSGIGDATLAELAPHVTI